MVRTSLSSYQCGIQDSYANAGKKSLGRKSRRRQGPNQDGPSSFNRRCHIRIRSGTRMLSIDIKVVWRRTSKCQIRFSVFCCCINIFSADYSPKQPTCCFCPLLQNPAGNDCLVANSRHILISPIEVRRNRHMRSRRCLIHGISRGNLSKKRSTPTRMIKP